jgi:hypothetical protein
VAILGGLSLALLPPSAAPPPPPAPAGPGRPLGAVTPAPKTATTVDPDRAVAVETLLRGRAAAIARHDEHAFLSSVDPYADQDFLTKQKALFANLAGVPIDEWTYQVRSDDTIDVSVLAKTTGADELWAPAVDLRYALHGADLAPTTRPMGYLFARRGTSWYLRSDTALDDQGRKTWRGPWDFASCQVISTTQGIVLFHPGNEAMAERLSGELDTSIAAVSAFWGTEWAQRVALLLPDSPEEMRALVGSGFPVESVVAVAVADRVDTDAHVVTGQRVVLSPAGSRALSVASLRVVLRHEILHVAARAQTVDGSPMWLLEGFADYVGYRDSGITLPQGAPDLADEVKKAGPPASLPEDKEFRAQGRELDLAYQAAWSMARFVAEKYGEDKLIAMYRTLAAAGPVSASQTDAMLRGVLAVDRAALIEGWRQYLRDTLA